MSIVLTNDSNYTAIASSIRSKLGVSTTYLPSEMSDAINSIPTGSGYSITVTTSHCTASTSNPTSIGEGNIAELLFTPDAGYELAPPTVTGASLRNKSSDRIEIENPTGNVTINIEAVQPDYFWVENVGTSKAYLSEKDGFMYSTDKLNWTTSTQSLSAGAKIYIKGNIGKTTGSGNTPVPSYGSYKIAIGGNVFTLLDYSGILEDYDSACYFMFYNNGCIVDASQLHINNVGKETCNFMFVGCTSLTQAPSLPITTLDTRCYNEMFKGCTSLVTPPSLPATTLKEGCYQSMFDGCTSLTTAPSLPATTLAVDCYMSMFIGCTSLTTAPSLTATITVSNGRCYYRMFKGCTSLTTAPELPSTTVNVYSYYEMFSGCTSLATAPQLPATTLSIDCYSSMFNGCTSLTTAPELPATMLAEDCYSSMFKGCTSLVTPPSLPATTLNARCYHSMFYGCTSLTTAPTLPATTLAKDCYSVMFYNCTSLTTVPELQATTLTSYCYQSMFSGCTSLKVYSTSGEGHDKAWSIPTEGVFSTSTTTSTQSYMFYGVETDNVPADFYVEPGKQFTYYTQNQPV